MKCAVNPCDDPFSAFFLPQAQALMSAASCDTEARLRVAGRASRILGLVSKSRSEGLLSLENEDFSGDPELGDAVLSVCDGMDVSVVLELMVARTFASERTGEALLSDLILIRGVCALSRAMNPDALRRLFLAFLGNDPSCAAILGRPDGSDVSLGEENNSQLIRSIAARAIPQGETDRLSPLLSNLDDVGIRALIREIDEAVWVRALAWTSAAALERLVRNLGKGERSSLLTEIANGPLPPAESWKKAQEHIVAACRGRAHGRE